jgi:hypothetical protein
MKKLLFFIATLITISSYILMNWTLQQKIPVKTGWIFTDTGNCEIRTVST